jgi:thiol-disulfide isomerase/thioredoxin
MNFSIKAIVFFFLTSSSIILGQKEDTVRFYSFIDDDLVPLETTVEEGTEEVKLSLDLNEVAVYDPSGNQLQPMEAYALLIDEDYVKDAFVDDNGVTRAIVVFKKERTSSANITKKDYENAKFSRYSENHPALGKMEFNMINEEKFSVNGDLDSVLVLNFWFTKCKPCIAELPVINKVVQDYTNKKVKFLAATFEDEASIKNFLKEHDFSYQIATSAKSIISALKISHFPTHLVVNKDGKIIYWESGLQPKLDLKLIDHIDYALDIQK